MGLSVVWNQIGYFYMIIPNDDTDDEAQQSVTPHVMSYLDSFSIIAECDS